MVEALTVRLEDKVVDVGEDVGEDIQLTLKAQQMMIEYGI